MRPRRSWAITSTTRRHRKGIVSHFRLLPKDTQNPTNPPDEIIDLLLDQEGFECDPISRVEGDTPLHSAIRWINSQSEENWAFGAQLLEMMLEAGSDPRLKNKAHLSAYDLTDPRNVALKSQLADAADVMLNQGDYIVDDGDLMGADEVDEGEHSASDSDFDEEEYKRDIERRKREKAQALAAPNGDSF